LNQQDAETIDMQYPLIHQAVQTGRHFSEGHREFLEAHLGVPIRKTSMRPDIFLSQPEMEWVSEIKVRFEYDGPYWIIVAGGKNDYTLKVYNQWQRVVDLLRGKIRFVQVGDKAHNHPLLKNIFDMRGQTDLRQLFRLSYHAEGAVCAVSLQMVVMQALRKPCVVVAGGREGMRWQAINDHRYIHTGGILNCSLDGGCWKSKIGDCLDVVNGVPRCMDLIEPEEIVRQIELYYDGGRLTYDR
jgi:ADP-heptose:LPS heptosyltransferase